MPDPGKHSDRLPLGILSGIYISEYTRDNWLVKLIRIMTNNLSGVPSIVFGLFGMRCSSIRSASAIRS